VRPTVKRHLPLTLTLLIIFLDRLTKQIVEQTLALHQSVPFLGNLVRWTRVHNDGIVFGWEIFGIKMLAILSVIAVFVVIVIFYNIDDEPKGVRWILAAILGGAIGNTFDRIVYGYVVDFVDVDFPDFIMERFAVFNVADSAVSVGVTILVLMLLFTSYGRELPGEDAVKTNTEAAGGTDDSVLADSPDVSAQNDSRELS